jgi:hypothetical protein
MGKLGSTILKEIMAAPASSRDKMILDLLSARNIPSWSFEWRPIRRWRVYTAMTRHRS